MCRNESNCPGGILYDRFRFCEKSSEKITVLIKIWPLYRNNIYIYIYQGSSKQELLVMEALFIADRKPPLNSQEEGRDRVLNIF